jgi:hypothetical protein
VSNESTVSGPSHGPMVPGLSSGSKGSTEIISMRTRKYFLGSMEKFHWAIGYHVTH